MCMGKVLLHMFVILTQGHAATEVVKILPCLKFENHLFSHYKALKPFPIVMLLTWVIFKEFCQFFYECFLIFFLQQNILMVISYEGVGQLTWHETKR